MARVDHGAPPALHGSRPAPPAPGRDPEHPVVTWLRRPLPVAVRRTRDVLRGLPWDRVSAAGVWLAVRGLPWVLRERRPLPGHAERRFAALEQAQRTSTARRYVS